VEPPILLGAGTGLAWWTVAAVSLQGDGALPGVTPIMQLSVDPPSAVMTPLRH
jgi:hypothetical protein